MTSNTATMAHVIGDTIRCGYCPKTVVFRPTYLGGAQLCFDAEEMPRRRDHNNTGWIAGPFYIGDKIIDVWAPWHHHPHAHRRRAHTVAQLHQCSGQTSWENAA